MQRDGRTWEPVVASSDMFLSGKRGCRKNMFPYRSCCLAAAANTGIKQCHKKGKVLQQKGLFTPVSEVDYYRLWG